jgi:hypothetical protein
VVTPSRIGEENFLNNSKIRNLPRFKILEYSASPFERTLTLETAVCRVRLGTYFVVQEASQERGSDSEGTSTRQGLDNGNLR